MKKTLMIAVLSLMTFGFATQVMGQNAMAPTSASKADYAEIKFDTLKIDLGTFSEKEAERHCTFNFTNVGGKPLIINQAFASCGCTVPTFTKEPVKPGETGKIEVTYNGKGKFPGHFSKVVTVRSNARTELVRLFIEGTMTK